MMDSRRRDNAVPSYASYNVGRPNTDNSAPSLTARFATLDEAEAFAKLHRTDKTGNAAALILNRLRCDNDGPETAHTRVLLYADDTHIKLTLWNRVTPLTPGKRYRVTIEEVE